MPLMPGAPDPHQVDPAELVGRRDGRVPVDHSHDAAARTNAASSLVGVEPAERRGRAAHLGPRVVARRSNGSRWPRSHAGSNVGVVDEQRRRRLRRPARRCSRCSPLPIGSGTKTAGSPSAVISLTVLAPARPTHDVGGGVRELHAIDILLHDVARRRPAGAWPRQRNRLARPAECRTCTPCCGEVGPDRRHHLVEALRAQRTAEHQQRQPVRVEPEDGARRGAVRSPVEAGDLRPQRQPGPHRVAQRSAREARPRPSGSAGRRAGWRSPGRLFCSWTTIGTPRPPRRKVGRARRRSRRSRPRRRPPPRRSPLAPTPTAALRAAGQPQRLRRRPARQRDPRDLVQPVSASRHQPRLDPASPCRAPARAVAGSSATEPVGERQQRGHVTGAATRRRAGRSPTPALTSGSRRTLGSPRRRERALRAASALAVARLPTREGDQHADAQTSSAPEPNRRRTPAAAGCR